MTPLLQIVLTGVASLLSACLGGWAVKRYEFGKKAEVKKRDDEAALRAARVRAEAQLRIAERDDLADFRRELKAEVDDLKRELRTCQEKHDETRLELERARIIHRNMKADLTRLEKEVTELRAKSIGVKLAKKLS